MNYKVYLTETFRKSMKILKKKYRRAKDDIASTIQTIEEDPTIGDPIPGWNKEIWKAKELRVPMLRRENAVDFGQFTSGSQEKSLFICWQHILRGTSRIFLRKKSKKYSKSLIRNWLNLHFDKFTKLPAPTDPHFPRFYAKKTICIFC